MPQKSSAPVTGFPLGIDNTTREADALRSESGQRLTLREAENIDLSDSGRPARRDGYEQVVAGTQMHSAWSDDYLDHGYVVDGDTLYVVREDASTEAIHTGLALGMPLSYHRINDAVAWCNGVQSGLITRTLDVIPWACATPASQPDLSATDGGLDRGTYQVAVTFIDAQGRESGAQRAAMIELSTGGGIALAGLPQPPAGGRVRIYCTTGNDGVLRAALTVGEGIHATTIAHRPTGRPLETQHLRVLLPGHLVAFGNGRQYVARGNEVMFSPTLRYGLGDPRKHRVRFNGRITMMAFVGDGTDGAGLYVADGKRTYFLAGPDPMGWSQRIVQACGAVPGAFGLYSGEALRVGVKQPVPVWLTQNGKLTVGLPGGQLDALEVEGGARALIDSAQSGALLLREDANGPRLLASLQGARPQGLTVQDRIVARVYRHDETP